MVETPTVLPADLRGPFRVVSAGRTDVGARRSLNEDTFLLDDRVGLWAVADGMGGHDGGDRASAVVAGRLAEIRREDDAHVMLMQLRDRIYAAHLQLRDEARQRGVATMGSTVAALMQVGGHCVFAWVGDSRGYLLRDGRIEQVTSDHSLVQELVASGRLSPEDAERHPDAHVLTRAVGGSDQLSIDFRQRRLRAGDRCILCSDGLTRCVPDEVILQTVLDLRHPESICEALIDRALEAGAPDNVTVVTVAFD